MADIDVKKGTTTVGIRCKDAVILASDSKSSMSNLVASKTAQKVYQIDDKIVLTTAGGAGDTQNLVRVLKAEINIYKMSRNNNITVRAVKTLVANILQGNRMFPIMAMLIIGGHDKTGFHIYSLDPVGGGDEDKFVSTGSGSPIAYGVLESKYTDDIKMDEGIKLAMESIKAARERDIFSGGTKLQIAVITEDGTKILTQEELESLKK